MLMRYPWRILLTILFLNSIIYCQVHASETKKINLLILDKSSSSKYEIEFSKSYQFRNLSFELLSCKSIEFDKYIDNAALLKINQNDNIFIGWFFKFSDELNLYSNKIYEISLTSC